MQNTMIVIGKHVFALTVYIPSAISFIQQVDAVVDSALITTILSVAMITIGILMVSGMISEIMPSYHFVRRVLFRLPTNDTIPLDDMSNELDARHAEWRVQNALDVSATWLFRKALRFSVSMLGTFHTMSYITIDLMVCVVVIAYKDIGVHRAFAVRIAWPGMNAWTNPIAISGRGHHLPSYASVAAAVERMPDSASKVCVACMDKFTLLNRRHHCRGCGKLMCAKCAPKREITAQAAAAFSGAAALLAEIDPNNAAYERLCAQCYVRFQ